MNDNELATKVHAVLPDHTPPSCEEALYLAIVGWHAREYPHGINWLNEKFSVAYNVALEWLASNPKQHFELVIYEFVNSPIPTMLLDHNKTHAPIEGGEGYMLLADERLLEHMLRRACANQLLTFIPAILGTEPQRDV